MLVHQSLANGTRLRLARPGDADGLRALAQRTGEALEVGELASFDPRDRAVICAVTVGGEVVGVGCIRLRDGDEPDLLVAEEAEVREALREALVERHANLPRPKAPRRERLRAVARRARRPS